MIEVEMKFPAADFAQVERILSGWTGESLDEADHYFNAPDRDFAKTDEALRIRRIGAKNRVTYKGPKLDAQTKSRTEVEVPLADGENIAEEFARLLQHLGYKPVTVVKKHRRTLQGQRDGFDVEVCLDDVASVGRFVEIEIQAPDADFDRAKKTLLDMAKELGLERSERRSYLEMLLGK